MKEINNDTLSLRSYKGKKLVSYLRNGDYAHAGEIESIHLVLDRFEKNSNRWILDAGCGLGGTANYIQKNNWGMVIGVDIEKESIDYAANKYPGTDFYVSNITNIQNLFLERKFDLICIFNSFYAFKEQALTLKALEKVGKENAELIIFDYSDLRINMREAARYPKVSSLSSSPFLPIRTQTIGQMLLESGWKLHQILDISKDYLRWYASLIKKLKDNKAFILNEFGNSDYCKAYDTYLNIYKAILDKKLGGVIVYAVKSN